MLFVVEIDGWKTGIRFSSSHILPGHKTCGVLHGHTYAIHARLYGAKNNQDFILDFSKIKTILRDIAQSLDHSILIPKTNENFTINEKEIELSFDKKRYIFPRQDCILLPINNTTAENLAEYIVDEVLKKIAIPKNVHKIQIGVDEGFGQSALCEKNLG